MLPGLLDALASLRRSGHELIVVDGGSRDGSLELARNGADHVLASARGRARQMNAGAAIATGDVLLFVHADTRLPADAIEAIAAAVARGAAWGRFDVRIVGRHYLLPLIAAAMNLRSRLTGIATGDQAIFAQRKIFTPAGGFPEIALMEDIALSRRLKRFGRPACLHARVTTSGRRWERRGVLRTMLLMWRLRFAYFCGASPANLARFYDDTRGGDPA